MRVVFMGTPEYAVPSLEALAREYNIVGVYTQPDRPKGRGKKVEMSAVKQQALKLGLEVFQPQRLRAAHSMEQLAALEPDIIITAAYGQILSKKILNLPKYGTVNVHASLLPAYRGPAPINWCLINGENTTGVTIMMTDAGIDTGDIVSSSSIRILPEDTAGSLTQRLSVLGANILMDTLPGIINRTAVPVKQNEQMATRHPMLEKRHGNINWDMDAQRIANLIRGVNPWPGAYTYHGRDRIRIWKAAVADCRETNDKVPGTVLASGDKASLFIAAKNACLQVFELQRDNKSRLSVQEFLRGYPIEPGSVLGGMDDAQSQQVGKSG